MLVLYTIAIMFAVLGCAMVWFDLRWRYMLAVFVVMLLIGTPAAPRESNMIVATPVWVRMPMPTAETFASPISMASSPVPSVNVSAIVW